MKKPTTQGRAVAAAAPKGLAPDQSLGAVAPPLVPNLAWTTMGSSGLRQYGGWVREEFLPQLRGRQAARTYREMSDNSPTVGAILFAIKQSMRQVAWHVDSADDTPDAAEGVEFLESCMEDMAQPWPDFVSDSLSMLPYGFAAHEIVYKVRAGKQARVIGDAPQKASSRFTDGMVGWSKLALRGQDTIIKWFFDREGEITGLTQEPWFGGQVDIPIEKLLLFRPSAWKNNPEGFSILRTAYRPWWFTKRLEEQEAIALERMSGTPEYRIPMQIFEGVEASDPKATASFKRFQDIVTGSKLDEQMGLVTPSDTFLNGDGSRSNVPAFEFRYNVPSSTSNVDFTKPIERYKLDIMTSVLADFLTLGHGARGTQSLATTKIDLFFQGIEGWLESNAATINDAAVGRLWNLNGLDEATRPNISPNMPKRVDLDVLGTFIFQMAQAGARLFPDDNLENYLRDVADLPELTEDMMAATPDIPIANPANAAGGGGGDPAADPTNPDGTLQKHIAGMMARRMERQGYLPRRANIKKRKKRR